MFSVNEPTNPIERYAPPIAAKAQVYDDMAAMVEAIGASAKSGDHVLVMSNGGFGGVHQKLLDALTRLFSALAWPVLVGVVLVKFGPSLKDFFQSMGEFPLKGAGFELDRPERPGVEPQLGQARLPAPRRPPCFRRLRHLARRAAEMGYRLEPAVSLSFDVAGFYNAYDHLRTIAPGAPTAPEGEPGAPGLAG